VALLKAGGCWKMERRRVRRHIRLNHCLGVVNFGDEGRDIYPRKGKVMG
jgi:hypothetical protein